LVKLVNKTIKQKQQSSVSLMRLRIKLLSCALMLTCRVMCHYALWEKS